MYTSFSLHLFSFSVLLEKVIFNSHQYFTSFWPESPQAAQRWPEWVDVSLVKCSKSQLWHLPFGFPWDLVMQHDVSTIRAYQLLVQTFSQRPMLKSVATTGNTIPEYTYSPIHWCKAKCVNVRCRCCAGLWARNRYSPLPWGKPPGGGSETHKQPQYGAYLWNLWDNGALHTGSKGEKWMQA